MALLSEGSDGPYAGVRAELAPDVLYFEFRFTEVPGVMTLKYALELGDIS